jgi:hypothetical protein
MEFPFSFLVGFANSEPHQYWPAYDFGESAALEGSRLFAASKARDCPVGPKVFHDLLADEFELSLEKRHAKHARSGSEPARRANEVAG